MQTTLEQLRCNVHIIITCVNSLVQYQKNAICSISENQNIILFPRHFTIALTTRSKCFFLQTQCSLDQIYFKEPRRCQVFGIHAKGIGKQMNYLIDEAVTCGKGAKGVIFLLHHFLESYGLGEQHLELFADNCAEQNKNAYMMWYLC